MSKYLTEQEWLGNTQTLIIDIVQLFHDNWYIVFQFGISDDNCFLKKSFPYLQRYKLLVEADQRRKLDCRVTMSVSWIIFLSFPKRIETVATLWLQIIILYWGHILTT